METTLANVKFALRKIDIQKCLNLLRNKNLIAKFKIKSKRKDLEKELETFKTLKKALFIV